MSGRTGLGVLTGRRGTACTVVFDVVGSGRFGLLDPTGQDTELARWGSSLQALYANPELLGLQWLTSTRPHPMTPDPLRRGLSAGASDERTAYDVTHAGHGALREGQHAQGGLEREDLERDYTQLLAATRAQALTHQHLLAVTLTAAAGADGDGTARLADASRRVAAGLLQADLLARPLDAVEVRLTLRRLLTAPTLDTQPAPARGGSSDEFRQAAPDRAGEAGPGPVVLSCRARWEHCQTDDTVHRSYAVTAWPRLAVTGDWLAPLLHATPPAGTARLLTVHTRPVPALHAARRARAATARAQLDADDRTRLGFTPAGRTDPAGGLTATDAAMTEAELAAGYRMTDLTALVTLTAPDLTALDAATAHLRTLAATSHLDLRPLHGQHLTALASTLPLGLHPGATP